MKILITAGATCEPIDDVRYLSNVSTGRTGMLLASMLADLGHSVFLLCSRSAGERCPEHPGIIAKSLFSSTEDLRQQLQSRLSSDAYDAVIQCAAVSDYRPEAPTRGKLSSDSPELVLRLTPTPKLLPLLKSYSSAPLFVIGFKLTSHASPEEARAAVEKLFKAGNTDLVIHNDLRDRESDGDRRLFRVYKKNMESIDAKGLKELVTLLSEKLSQATLAQSH